MSHYDPTLKALIETVPGDWLTLLERNQPRRGRRPRVEAIDADISTISGAADKVLLVRDRPNWLLHVEFHAGHDGAEQPSKYHARNSILGDRHQLGVQTLVVVLKQDADSPAFSGTFERSVVGHPNSRNGFTFEVCRVWQLDPEWLLRGCAGILPLVPISAVTDEGVPAIIQQMQQRMDQLRLKKSDADTLWTATNILMGLRFSGEFAAHLLRGVRGMKESTTYQAIVEEGRAEGREEGRAALRLAVRDLCEPRLGPPDTGTLAALEAITDIDRLRDLIRRASSAATWHDLLGSSPTPAPRRRKRR